MIISRDCKQKYEEIKSLAENILNSIENYDSDNGTTIMIEFKNFCNISFNFIADWIKKREYLKKEYIDICHGISNGDKHYKIDRKKENYNSSNAIYRISSPNLFQSSTGAHTYKEESNNMHIEPGENIMIIETQKEKYTAKEIIEGTLKELEEIIQFT